MPLLWRASLRDLSRHRVQGALSILGIALGVAVVIAVDIANDSARRAFERSVELVAGRATHRIESATGQIPDRQYADLADTLAGLDASPVIEAQIRLGTATFTLLGLDPLALARIDPAVGTGAVPGLADLLTIPGALLLTAADADRLGVRPGDSLALSHGGDTHTATLVGVLAKSDRDATDRSGLAIADIASAQELTDRLGSIDTVNLALTPDQALDLAPRLPPGLRLAPAAQRSESLRHMTHAFHTNLTAMSLLAVLVGGFIVYNTMTFAVLRRRALLGTLRTLGCTRGQIFTLVLGEALALALIGSLLGTVLGLLAGWGLVQLVSRTINDLYFALTVGALHLSPGSLATGIALGLGMTLIVALGPAIEAASSQPRDLLRPSGLERRVQRWTWRLAICGLGLLLLGLGLARLPSQSIGIGFAALFLAVLGYSLAVPLLLRAFAGALTGLLEALGPGRGSVSATLATRGVGASITRTGLAVAALTVAVSATVGVGIMIESFRGSLIQWLESTLSSDLYVSAPDAGGQRPGGQLPAGLGERIAAIPGIRSMSQGRRVQVDADGRPVPLLALASGGIRGFHLVGEQADRLWERFDLGELILASQPFAYHRQVGLGDRVALFTAQGWRDFTIGGIFRDYGSDSGLLVMDLATYAAAWKDPAIATLGLRLAPDADAQWVHTQVLQITESQDRPLLVTPNREIREQSIAIFDRTFAITRVLRLLAIAVAFVGVLSALMALQLEQRRTHAILRASGMTGAEIARLVLLQTSLLGLAAGLFALPLGVLLGDLLIDVVNVRSFGWTMDLRLPPDTLWGGVLLAWLAALLAGLHPARSAARVAPAQALRAE